MNHIGARILWTIGVMALIGGMTASAVTQNLFWLIGIPIFIFCGVSVVIWEN